LKGHTRTPHDWILAYKNDGPALGLITLLEHYRFTGEDVGVHALAEACGMSKSRVSRVREKWRNHCLEAESAAVYANGKQVGSKWEEIPPQPPETADDSENSGKQVGTKWEGSGKSFYLPKEQEQEQEERESPPPAGEADVPSPSLTERARALWPDLVAAAAPWKVWSTQPGKRQLDIVRQRIADAGEDACLNAVRGYGAKVAAAQRRGSDWDGEQYFTVTSIFRPANFDANVDAAEAQAPEDPFAKARRELAAARGTLQ
jgi:hypothetical protein